MSTVVPQSPQSTTFDLLAYYRLEADRSPQAPTKIQVLDRWLRIYPEPWVRLALIESLYQGRYKAISVEQLLALWNRRGEPVYHFNHEFEDLVCHNVPRQMGKNQDSLRQESRKSSLPLQNLAPESKSQGAVDGRSHEPLSTDPDEVLNISSSAQPFLRDEIEEPWTDVSDSQHPLPLDIQQLLPITMGHLGIEPIHQFMPEAQPVEFCEKLEAIARFPS